MVESPMIAPNPIKRRSRDPNLGGFWSSGLVNRYFLYRVKVKSRLRDLFFAPNH
jgi:hypothetical protein